MTRISGGPGIEKKRGRRIDRTPRDREREEIVRGVGQDDERPSTHRLAHTRAHTLAHAAAINNNSIGARRKQLN